MEIGDAMMDFIMVHIELSSSQLKFSNTFTKFEYQLTEVFPFISFSFFNCLFQLLRRMWVVYV